LDRKIEVSRLGIELFEMPGPVPGFRVDLFLGSWVPGKNPNL